MEFKGVISKGCAICKLASIVGSENFDINRVTNYLINKNSSFVKKETLGQVFSYEFGEIFKNLFLQNTYGPMSSCF